MNHPFSGISSIRGLPSLPLSRLILGFYLLIVVFVVVAKSLSYILD